MKKDILTKPFAANVDTQSLVARLNETADFEWSFDLANHEIRNDEVIVLARLSMGGITKAAFGGSRITRDTSGKEVSLSDDAKAAASDAFKNAASLFGVGVEVVAATSTTPTPTMPRGNGNGAQSFRSDQPEPIDRITSRQLAAIHALARRRGISLPELGVVITQKTGKDAPQNLTKKEASVVLDELVGGNGAP